MPYILLIISLFLAVSRNIVTKRAGKHFFGFSALINLNIIVCAMALPCFMLFGIDTAHFGDIKFVILALLFALFLLGGAVSQILALKYAPAATVSLVYCSGFILTTLFSVLIYREQISVYRIILICFVSILIAAILLARGKGSQRTSLRFLLFAIPAMLCSGSLGIVQKEFTKSYGESYSSSYLFLAFFMIFVCCIILRIIYKGGEIKALPSRGFILPAIIYSVCFIATNKLNLYLIEAVPASVFFPVMNSGAIALTAVFSAIILKEKLGALKLTLISLVIISICIIPFI